MRPHFYDTANKVCNETKAALFTIWHKQPDVVTKTKHYISLNNYGIVLLDSFQANISSIFTICTVFPALAHTADDVTLSSDKPRKTQ